MSTPPRPTFYDALETCTEAIQELRENGGYTTNVQGRPHMVDESQFIKGLLINYLGNRAAKDKPFSDASPTTPLDIQAGYVRALVNQRSNYYG